MSEFTPEGSFPPILTGALQLLERVVKDTKLGLPNEAEAALNYVKERLVLSDIPDEMRWKCPKCDEYMMMIFSKEAPSEKTDSWPFEAIACVESGQIMWEPGKRPRDGVLLYVSKNAAPQSQAIRRPEGRAEGGAAVDEEQSDALVSSPKSPLSAVAAPSEQFDKEEPASEAYVLRLLGRIGQLESALANEREWREALQDVRDDLLEEIGRMNLERSARDAVLDEAISRIGGMFLDQTTIARVQDVLQLLK